jgi:signal transduction histidine kinase
MQERESIIARARAHVAARTTPRPTDAELRFGVPLFLDQFIARLIATTEATSDIGAAASQHGAELLHAGFTIGQVVHDYGDICQAITTIAVEQKLVISAEEFRALNMCLDVAIAEAVTKYSQQRESAIVGQGIEHLGFLAHELRNLLNTATLAVEAVRSGQVGISGSTGRLLDKSLDAMRDLVSRSLAEVRLEVGPPRQDLIVVTDFLEEIEIAATSLARKRDLELSIAPADPRITVVGDAQIISSVVTNLVQNACKFTRRHGHIRVSTRVTEARVIIDVADECGGLPRGATEGLFRPYEQRGEDRSGVGLGLAISLKGARAVGGDIAVRDVPGVGCVFSVDLKRGADVSSRGQSS